YGIKTPDGLGLHKVLPGDPPEGIDPSQFWQVNETVPEGFYRTGWQLVAGVVEPVLQAIPTPEPQPRRQDTRKILDRLTSDEVAALSLARQQYPQIDLLVLKAVAEGG